ncbi:MAG: anaerobic sulfatase-maturation protein [Phocaeicola sp.]
MSTIAPFSQPLYVMTKPVGSLCNLACSYCYYLEKHHLYKQQKLTDFTMSDELLERFIQHYISSQTIPQVLFTWHGGEPLLRPLSFYKKVVKLQKQYAAGRTIDNCIQTNGTLLTDEWCAFFKEHNWLVGISIDGPQEYHDLYRRNKSNEPSFAKVMEGIALLNKHGVEWNGMAVVNEYNVHHPLEFYRFFKSIGCRYIQFTPVVERLVAHGDGRYLASQADEGEYPLASFSVNPQQWGAFICAIFDEWVRHDVGSYYIQLFDATLANWVGHSPGVCSLAKRCGHAAVMEYNGDVYSCDHFVFPSYKLGNIYEKSLTEMLYSKEQLAFGAAKQQLLPTQCKECRYLFACNGECPKNRFVETKEVDKPLNFLCQGYYHFFSHVAPYMDFMKRELLAGRAPANIMEELREGLR